MKFAHAVAIALVVSSIAGCGGADEEPTAAPSVEVTMLEDYEISDLRGKAFTVSYDVQETCIQVDRISTIDAGEAADKLADIHAKLPEDETIKKAIREVATTMRGCGAADQADRLNALTD